MKQIKMLLTFCVGVAMHTTAQNKTCYLMDGQAHNVYVFSKKTAHTIIELFGERTPTHVLNLIYVKTCESKVEIDSLCLAEALSGTFIIPNKDAAKTLRFCNEKEYAAALKNKMELNIEDE